MRKESAMRVIKEANVEDIKRAVGMILEGVCSRIDVSDGVKVYECKNIIRIDLKVVDDANQ